MRYRTQEELVQFRDEFANHEFSLVRQEKKLKKIDFKMKEEISADELSDYIFDEYVKGKKTAELRKHIIDTGISLNENIIRAAFFDASTRFREHLSTKIKQQTDAEKKENKKKSIQ